MTDRSVNIVATTSSLLPTYKFTTEVVSRKNIYRVQPLVNLTEETEAEAWKLFIWTFLLTTEADITEGQNKTYLYREKHLEIWKHCDTYDKKIT